MISRQTIPQFFNRLSPNAVTAIGLGLALIVGLTDYALSNAVSLSFFYLVPIALVAWYAGRDRGLALALCCGLIWFGVTHGASIFLEHPLLGYGDLATDLSFFIVVSLLVAYHRRLLERERTASRTDFLTGALNRRAFYELAGREIDRVRRHTRPFTIAYFDLDNFKAVNDEHGHAAGDEVLRHIVSIVTRHLRVTDSIARLGGDEFAVLLPETDRAAARAVVDKIRHLLQEDMAAQQWPITISIGVLTCERPPASIDAMLRTADQLMYQVKAQGKNAVVYSGCREMNMPVQVA